MAPLKQMPIENYKHPRESSLAAARLLRGSTHGLRLANVDACLEMAGTIRTKLGCELTELHHHFGPYPLFRPGRDADTALHQRLYRIHQEMTDQYRLICNVVIRELIGEPCYVQAIPTYRAGLPNNRWVGSFHRDSDFGHSPWELNVICALTKAQGTAALQVETAPNTHSYEALNVKAGDLVMFDHIDRLHGCKINREGYSVLSIDFRFVPERLAKEAFRDAGCSFNTKTPFIPGSYFSEHPLPISS